MRVIEPALRTRGLQSVLDTVLLRALSHAGNSITAKIYEALRCVFIIKLEYGRMCVRFKTGLKEPITL